jgi:hypothetical protein
MADDTPVSGTVAGAWTARVARPSGTASSTFHFTPGGRAFLVSGGVGAGTWTTTGPDRFSYRIAELLLDGSGARIGWVDIDQQAVRSGDTFTSTGVTVVYDIDDVRTHSATVGVSAVRADAPGMHRLSRKRPADPASMSEAHATTGAPARPTDRAGKER